jgi:hypothetical protein
LQPVASDLAKDVLLDVGVAGVPVDRDQVLEPGGERVETDASGGLQSVLPSLVERRLAGRGSDAGLARSLAKRVLNL